jgi:hypothetical protein
MVAGYKRDVIPGYLSNRQSFSSKCAVFLTCTDHIVGCLSIITYRCYFLVNINLFGIIQMHLFEVLSADNSVHKLVVLNIADNCISAMLERYMNVNVNLLFRC